MYPAQCALRSEGATPRCLKIIHCDASETKPGIDYIASMSSRKGTWPQPGMTLISDFCKIDAETSPIPIGTTPSSARCTAREGQGIKDLSGAGLEV